MTFARWTAVGASVRASWLMEESSGVVAVSTGKQMVTAVAATGGVVRQQPHFQSHPLPLSPWHRLALAFLFVCTPFLFLSSLARAPSSISHFCLCPFFHSSFFSHQSGLKPQRTRVVSAQGR